MPKYGFTAYDRSSEIHFSKFNNQYILKPAPNQDYIYLKDLDYGRNHRERFILPHAVIKYFKDNDLNFHFLPVAIIKPTYYHVVIDTVDVFRKLDNWRGGDIDLYLYYIPKSTSIFFQYIRRLSNDDRKVCQAKIIVGFE